MTSAVITSLKQLVGADAGTVVYECRHCGTTVDNTTDTCPACGTAEIVQYRFS